MKRVKPVRVGLALTPLLVVVVFWGIAQFGELESEWSAGGPFVHVLNNESCLLVRGGTTGVPLESLSGYGFRFRKWAVENYEREPTSWSAVPSALMAPPIFVDVGNWIPRSLCVWLPFWLLAALAACVAMWILRPESRMRWLGVIGGVILVGTVISVIHFRGPVWVKVRGEVEVTDYDNYDEIVDPNQIRVLHGKHNGEANLSEYLDYSTTPWTRISGGNIQLFYDDSTPERFWVETEYQCARRLTKREIDFLVDETQAQWSDGWGENFGFDVELPEGIWVEIWEPDQEVFVTVGREPSAEELN